MGTVHLQAGPLSATLAGIDLFDVRYGNVIIAERIYAAVRDEDWNHVRVTWDALRVRHSPNGFSVRFRARFNAEPIDVVCVGTITGDPTGRIVYELDGEAFNDFQYCKMGLCVHHALHSSQGRPYRARGRGRQWSGRLPDEVDAGYRMGALFREFDELTIQSSDSITATFRFHGDMFEMQDHRNWGDANFKSYGTPLTVPFPRAAHSADRFHQTVELSVDVRPPTPSRRGPPTVTVTSEYAGLPPLGVRLSSPSGIAAEQVELLKQISLAHARLDISLPSANWRRELSAGAAIAAALSVPVELALSLHADVEEQLSCLDRQLGAAGVPIARILVLEGTGTGVTPATLMAHTAAKLRSVPPDVPILAGTGMFFATLNQAASAGLPEGGLFFPYSPQVHAKDDRSVMRNVRALPDMVKRCRVLTRGAPVHLSPVTLVPDSGPWAAGAPGPDDPPGTLDWRQTQLFVAAWTVAFLAQASRDAVDSVTVHDAAGARGLMESCQGPAYPKSFPSTPGQVFPVYRVVEELARARGSVGRRVQTTSAEVIGLSWRQEGHTHLLLASLTATSQHVRVQDASTPIVHWTARGVEPAGSPRVVASKGDGNHSTLTVSLRGYNTCVVTW